MTHQIDLETHPLTHLSVSDADGGGAWLAYGNDPAFSCSWPGSGSLSGGWYAVACDVEVLRGTLHDPCFYPDYGRGIAEEAKITLPLQRAKRGIHRIRTLARFSSDTIGLRFDPTVLPSEFRILGFSLRRLGRAEAASRMFRALLARQPPLGWPGLAWRTLVDLARGGPSRMADRMYRDYAAKPDPTAVSNYGLWLELYEDHGAEALALARSTLGELRATPVFSVVLPVYDAPERWLRRCIDSVVEQVYPHWELCIADDASRAPHVRRVLKEYEARDTRIKVVSRPQNGHISRASNSALDLATGDYIALLDHDDELSPLAFLECARAFEANPHWRMLFTDEDKIDSAGRRSDPYFKSDWNPDLLLSQNCVCHLTVYARDLVEEVGRFRPGFEGAQDWDLTLRVAERLEIGQIGHVPKVLYHWRMIEGSTALAPGEKNYAHLAAMRVIQDHLDRTGSSAVVEEMAGYSGYYRVRHPLPEPPPLVSLLVPTRDGLHLLRQCIDSVVLRTTYENYEIIILDNGSSREETHAYFRSLEGYPRIRIEPFDHPFNFSAINNHGASLARGSVLCLMNNDIEVINGDWLREMVSQALRPQVGAVGAMLYYPGDRIQHAGVILGIGGVAGHCYVGQPRGYPGDKHRGGLIQNMSAVTAACLVIRASVFAEVGGLDERLQVAFNDIDFCLRVREAGYRNLWTPFAELYHHESATRGYETTPEKIARFQSEESFMKARWGQILQADPYYNPNFSLDSAPFTLAFPPREWRVGGTPAVAKTVAGVAAIPEKPAVSDDTRQDVSRNS